MLRILSLLLLSLVLLITACSKDDPELEPTLEGTWKLQSSYIKYYRADGSLEFEGKQQLPAVTEEIVFTDKTLTIPTTFLGYAWLRLPGQLNPIIGQVTPLTVSYTYQGDMLTWTDTSASFSYSGSLTIAELTSNTLDVQYVQYVRLLPENTTTRRVTGGQYTR
ncbi:hypothetical protein [Hymenobacter defluvii]|uniref:Lipocalin-like domain-containing protein n=1 Tax=Hymenobacter defluvii TaxID=2054411 RepID=A0ABS3TIG9_9BACT|nr:hypothetical protein [Hymenobacter defluvii]MBO3273459.1 hypothetical protein [Hymenobacter defluvii]